jgi:hypothetical protein
MTATGADQFWHFWSYRRRGQEGFHGVKGGRLLLITIHYSHLSILGMELDGLHKAQSLVDTATNGLHNNKQQQAHTSAFHDKFLAL